ncbi:hypothetical protein CPLU01_12779 [Colletotrichum plurivorum]|uniref:Uncharacterized protein n=1 Tax=Colletotrichum plurivorum TaxID=2175906 RepID=A0A8H6JWA0_9PEZI|nr:hypothetical protein CPLU01_12779 [Colletotrichum plurivorum]
MQCAAGHAVPVLLLTNGLTRLQDAANELRVVPGFAQNAYAYAPQSGFSPSISHELVRQHHRPAPWTTPVSSLLTTATLRGLTEQHRRPYVISSLLSEMSLGVVLGPRGIAAPTFLSLGTLTETRAVRGGRLTSHGGGDEGTRERAQGQTDLVPDITSQLLPCPKSPSHFSASYSSFLLGFLNA